MERVITIGAWKGFKHEPSDEELNEAKAQLAQGMADTIKKGSFIIKYARRGEMMYGNPYSATIALKVDMKLEVPVLSAAKSVPKVGDKMYHEDDPEDELTVGRVNDRFIHFKSKDNYMKYTISYARESVGTSLFYEQKNARIMHDCLSGIGEMECGVFKIQLDDKV